MKRMIQKSDNKISINIEFDLIKENPQTLHWLKNFVLTTLRENHDLTDEEMAKILGVTSRTIANWRYDLGIRHTRGGVRRGQHGNK